MRALRIPNLEAYLKIYPLVIHWLPHPSQNLYYNNTVRVKFYEDQLWQQNNILYLTSDVVKSMGVHPILIAKYVKHYRAHNNKKLSIVSDLIIKQQIARLKWGQRNLITKDQYNSIV